jgi:hypothetical protein
LPRFYALAWMSLLGRPTPPILALFLASWCHARNLIPLAPRWLVSQPFGA